MISGSLDKAITDINTLLDSPQRREEIAVRSRHYVAKVHDEATVMAVFAQALREAPL